MAIFTGQLKKLIPGRNVEITTTGDMTNNRELEVFWKSVRHFG